MIFATWQSLASSSHKIATQCAQLLGEKVTHTGTLDPMAQGVLVLLSGEDRFVKGSLSEWWKTYHFSILWGVNSDSGDLLGVVKKLEDTPENLKELTTVINNFPTQYEQTTPLFSALRHQGHSGFEIGKLPAGNTLRMNTPEKKRVVQLHDLKILGTEKMSGKDIKRKHREQVYSVVGEFRQQEVVESWQKNLSELDRCQFLITHHSVTTSPGTYIRQLVQDISGQLSIPATTWAITRTQNGPFAKEDCLELEELMKL